MRRYYLTTITGKGTGAEPFRPAVAEYAAGGEWGMLDLREDSTAAGGLAVAYADTPAPIDGAGVTLLGDDLKAPLAATAKQSFTGALGVSLADDSLPAMLAELLRIKRLGLCAPLRKMADGKIRIFLGEQIYGEPLPEYQKGTFTESFNKADSTTLGPDLTWEKWGGTGWQVKSNQGYHSGVGDEAASPTNTNATDDFYTQIKVNSWTSRPNLGAGVLTRANNSPQCYYGAFAQIADNNHTFEKMVNGSWTLVATIATSVSAGETLYLSSDGSNHIIKKNGAQIWSGTDSAVVNYFRAAMNYYSESSSALVYVDDFESADLTTAKVSADTGGGADASVSYPAAALTPGETGAGTEATLSRGMDIAESGSGLDAAAGMPAAVLFLGEVGNGADAETSLPSGALTLTETGSGVDGEQAYPVAVLVLVEAGAGIELLLARILAALESGEGTENPEDGNPLADLLRNESGAGLDALVALIQSVAVLVGDSGTGAEALEALENLAVLTDSGFASDALISRWLDGAESGAGMDTAELTAALNATGESGVGAETPFLTSLASMDHGLGNELLLILKDIIGGDRGTAMDTLKQMIATAGKSADARLKAGAGRKESAGGRRAGKEAGGAKMPSKEVKR